MDISGFANSNTVNIVINAHLLIVSIAFISFIGTYLVYSNILYIIRYSLIFLLWGKTILCLIYITAFCFWTFYMHNIYGIPKLKKNICNNNGTIL